MTFAAFESMNAAKFRRDVLREELIKVLRQTEGLSVDVLALLDCDDAITREFSAAVEAHTFAMDVESIAVVQPEERNAA